MQSECGSDGVFTQGDESRHGCSRGPSCGVQARHIDKSAGHSPAADRSLSSSFVDYPGDHRCSFLTAPADPASCTMPHVVLQSCPGRERAGRPLPPLQPSRGVALLSHWLRKAPRDGAVLREPFYWLQRLIQACHLNKNLDMKTTQNVLQVRRTSCLGGGGGG